MLSVLAAIGAVLMAIIEIPYPPAPWLKIEFSDIVILIAFSIYGFKSGLAIAIVKTLCDLLIQGISGPYAIGQITALVASLAYVVIIKVLKVNIKEDKTSTTLIKFGIILISVASFLTLMNYLFITPIYSGEFFWFQMDGGSSLGHEGSYIVAIIITYLPFNLLKGTLILSIFYLIYPRLEVILNRNNTSTDE